MKKQLTLAAMTLAAAALAAGTALAQKADSAHGKQMTYTGCLQQGQQHGTYVLTHVMLGKPGDAKAAKGGKAPEMLELSSKSIRLAAENGHKVMVMGETMKDKQHTKMMVTALESLNGTCQ